MPSSHRIHENAFPSFWTSQSPANINQSILPSIETESLCVQLLQNSTTSNSNSELESQKSWLLIGMVLEYYWPLGYEGMLVIS